MKPAALDVTNSRFREGRDEMNLADFPISALPRAQKKAGEGGQKLDRMEFTASRYDPATRQRIQQKVILTSTARDGLPTPADEHVILALLYVAKHSNNFSDPTVHFAPTQLFEIMGWAPNGRSYTRLRDVLRRLKALTIRYENAWWDISGRAYEEEVATGIISAYRIARQVSGPRREGQALVSWVTWTPQFQESLTNGNLKRLNLEVFFKLSTPTAQRMYRFLDKRFYGSPTVSMDLVEFACGHVGLTEVDNVALLKRRLAPAIAELEQIGFIEPVADVSERFEKVKVGQWRIHFKKKGEEAPARTEAKDEEDDVSPPLPFPAPVVPVAVPAPTGPAADLVREFYSLWDGSTTVAVPGPRDLQQAEALLSGRSPGEARTLLGLLVDVTRKEWPACRSLSGAAQKYLGEAVKALQAQKQREASRQQAEEQRQQTRQETTQQQHSEQQLQLVWDALPDEQRQAIEQQVRQRLGGQAPVAFLRRLCLQELSRRLAGPAHGSDSR